eukprot:CAMPEP_0203748860 /NCGR_PEP_ID=MMETSP0098-20131031/3625_1 /ASSEMBLY_ACC=CAM_ASM_000208 /TAXON_ID=96639 /ORGANISM=" , Strain NY0313808BC1" /LENGTH=151 /DNA_ID=CAMNT_0050637753 /DNA_START=1335 /DNA_END=1787 /DNA_ORIENTATION=+
MGSGASSHVSEHIKGDSKNDHEKLAQRIGDDPEVALTKEEAHAQIKEFNKANFDNEDATYDDVDSADLESKVQEHLKKKEAPAPAEPEAEAAAAPAEGEAAAAPAEGEAAAAPAEGEAAAAPAEGEAAAAPAEGEAAAAPAEGEAAAAPAE